MGWTAGPSHYNPLHKQLGWQPIRNHPRTPSHNFQNVSIMKQGRYFVFRWEQLLTTWCHPRSTPLASQNILRRRSWLIFALKNEDWAALLSLSLFKSGTSRSCLLSWTLCIPLFAGEHEKWENPRKCVTERPLHFWDTKLHQYWSHSNHKQSIMW